jgi:predicted dehydrogenase
MVKKVLIIGLGIGKLYQKVLSDTEQYNVVTIDIDPYKEPDFLDIETCKQVNPSFDLALVCVPNYLHEEMVMKLVTNDMAKVILVEKPGLFDFAAWISAVHIGEPNKLIMIKNNMYRDNYPAIIKTINENRFDIKNVNVCWLNKDRIPHPGSWFTTKKLAFGGVSRDLMPHLLSIYYSLFQELNLPVDIYKTQKYTLEDLKGTAYGKVNKDGVYDVDDYCRIKFRNTIKGSIVPVTLYASWKTDIEKSKIGIEIEFRDGNKVFYDFGLCPEYAYHDMIRHSLKMTKKEYKKQNDIDIWIHNIIDNVD